MMQTAADLLVYSLIIVGSSAGLAAWLLYRRLMSGIRTELRVHMSGGTEKRFDGVEVGREIKWIQDGEEMSAQIPITVDPGHTWRYGVHYRVFNITDGADVVIQVPWLQPNVHAKFLTGDAAAKERYRRRVRAYNSFKQAIAGLSSVNRWQAAALIILGIFAGLYFAPIIQGVLT